MFANSRKSITLVELLIAISLLAIMILGINSVDIFSRYHFLSTDRRAKIQNSVSLCLEHMNKNLASAIGNETLYGANSAVYVHPNSTNTDVLSVLADSNGNGSRDVGTSNDDYWIGYNFTSSTKRFSYCGQCTTYTCAACSITQETLANNITAFSASDNGSYINVSLTACWDPAATVASCGSSDNPSVTMSTSIALPSVANF